MKASRKAVQGQERMPDHKKILVLSSHTKSLFWFRMDMMRSFLQKGYEVVAVGSDAEPKWFDEFQKENIRYRNIPVSRNGLNPLADLRTYRAIKRLLAEERPDKIFSYQAKTVIYGGLAAHSLKIAESYPLIAGLGSVFRGQGIKNAIVRQILKNEYRLALRHAKTVMFQNNDDLDCFVKQGLVKIENTAIINGSGVNTQRFTPMPFPKELTFLMISRLIRDKGIFEYLEAARQLKKMHKAVHFLLAGPYDSNPSALKPEDLQPYLSDGTIEYLGELDDVRPAYARATVYVLPSYHEGTPKTVLEAMACGRPVITTDAPGCRETVKDGVNGFLVPAQNVQSLVSAMLKFVEQEQLSEAFGTAGRAIAVDKYDVAQVNSAISRILGL